LTLRMQFNALKGNSIGFVELLRQSLKNNPQRLYAGFWPDVVTWILFFR
jgi:hypothetical protein